MPPNINRQLRDAAQEGDLKKVRALLEQGADINAASHNDGYTPFLLALGEGHDEVWRYLLEAGARADASTTQGDTALHLAIDTGNVEALKLLLACGLSVESRDNLGTTPLIHAAECLAFEAVELLLQHGADPNAREKYQGTSLHAVYRGITMSEEDYNEVGAPLVALLEKHGADPTLKDDVGRRPEDYLNQ